jgi:hypothetical protein
MRSLVACTIVAAALSSTAVAEAKTQSAQPPSARACFRPADVRGFQAVDDQTVNVGVGVRDVYQLKLFARSPDIDWTQRIALKATASDWICSALDATVIVPSPIGAQRFPVTALRKLTPTEVAALPARQRP